MNNSIRIDKLFEKNQTYVGSLDHGKTRPELVVLTKEQFNEMTNVMRELSKQKNPKVLTFNRFVMAGMVEIKTDDKGYLVLPAHIKKAMKVPNKYKNVVYDKNSDTLLGNVFKDVICIKEFIPQNILIRVINKIKNIF